MGCQLLTGSDWEFLFNCACFFSRQAAQKSDDELIQIAKKSRTNTIGGDWAKATTKVNSLIDKASSSGLA